MRSLIWVAPCVISVASVLGASRCDAQAPLAVSSIATLRSTSYASQAQVSISGYYGPQTPGGGLFVLNPQETRADNSCTVIADGASPADKFDRVAPATSVFDCGAVGTGAPTTASTTAGSGSLTLASAADFAAGQSVGIVGAGAVTTVHASSFGTAAFVNGIGGTTTYSYKVASIDPSGGVGPASAPFTVSGAPSSLNLAVDASGTTASQGVILPVNFASDAVAAAVYKYNGSAYMFEGVVQAGRPCPAVPVTQPCWVDFGHTQTAPLGILTTPLGTAGADILYDTIKTMTGTSVALSSTTAGATLTAALIFHDDRPPIQAALTAGGAYALPCGTFYLGASGPSGLSGLSISNPNTYLHGSGKGCSTIEPVGVSDDITTTASQTGFDSLTLNDINKYGGFYWTLGPPVGSSAAGPAQVQVHDLNVSDAYNGINAGPSIKAEVEHIRGDTDVRGDISVYIWGGAKSNQTFYVYDYTSPKSWSAVGTHISGYVASVEGRIWTHISTAFTEVLIDDGSAFGAAQPPSFIEFYDLALNNCNTVCLDDEAGSQIKIHRPYFQGQKGDLALANVYTAATVSDFTIDLGGSIFGGDGPCVAWNGFDGRFTDLNTFQCGNSIGASPGIEIGNTSNGTSVSGNTNYQVSNAAANTLESSGIQIDSAAQNVSIGSVNLAGTSCDIYDQAGSPATAIAGSPNAPPTTLVHSNIGLALVVSSYPNMYAGQAGATASVCRTQVNVGSNISDAFDTATHLLSSTSPLAGIAVGSQFRFRAISGVNGIWSLGPSSDGSVTVNGSATGTIAVPSAGTGGYLVRRNVVCTVHSLTPTTAGAIDCRG